MKQRTDAQQGEPAVCAAARSEALAYVADLVRDPEIASDVVRRAVERRRLVRNRASDVRVHRAAIRLVFDAWGHQFRAAVTGPVDARELVEGLPRDHREPVLLHYWAALPVADIARVLDRPCAKVEQELDDAPRLLALLLETSAWPEEGRPCCVTLGRQHAVTGRCPHSDVE